MPLPAPWLCGSLQEGIPDSLCNITDTVCVEPQPKQSNFTDTYTHKIVRSCPISRLRNIDVPLNVSMRATATSSTLVLSRAFSLSTLPDGMHSALSPCHVGRDRTRSTAACASRARHTDEWWLTVRASGHGRQALCLTPPQEFRSLPTMCLWCPSTKPWLGRAGLRPHTGRAEVLLGSRMDFILGHQFFATPTSEWVVKCAVEENVKKKQRQLGKLSRYSQCTLLDFKLQRVNRFGNRTHLALTTRQIPLDRSRQTRSSTRSIAPDTPRTSSHTHSSSPLSRKHCSQLSAALGSGR
jgi:hypothetical protein